MPRKVKKVKVARGQRKKHTKKFWIILSSSIVGGIAIAVTTILLVYFLAIKEDEYKYFDEIDDSYKITWNQAKKKTDADGNELVEHMFIFFWSEDTLNPEDSKSDAKLEDNIEKLYKAIVNYNNSDNVKEDLGFALICVDDAKNKHTGIDTTPALNYYYSGTSTTSPFGVTDYKEIDPDDTQSYSKIDFNLDLTDAVEAITFVNKLLTL